MNFIIAKDTKELQFKDLDPDFATLQSQISKSFNLKVGEFNISYIDYDGDMIAVEDNDDLDVCIFEFTETSQVDAPIRLAIQDNRQKVPLKRASAKSSPLGSPRQRSHSEKSEIIDGFKKIKTEKYSEVQPKDDLLKSDLVSECGSVLSEKVWSVLDSKIEEEVEKRIQKLVEEKFAKSLASIHSKVESQAEEKEKLAQKKALEDEVAEANRKAEKDAKKLFEKEKKKASDLKKVAADKKKAQEARKAAADKKKAQHEAKKVAADKKKAEKEAKKQYEQDKKTGLVVVTPEEPSKTSLKDLQKSGLQALEDQLATSEIIKVETRQEKVARLKKMARERLAKFNEQAAEDQTLRKEREEKQKALIAQQDADHKKQLEQKNMPEEFISFAKLSVDKTEWVQSGQINGSVTGGDDWAYGHNRLTNPGKSTFNVQFTLAEKASSALYKFRMNCFAPWQMADCKVKVTMNDLLILEKNAPSEDKGRTNIDIEFVSEPLAQHKFKIEFVEGEGVLFLNHFELFNAVNADQAKIEKIKADAMDLVNKKEKELQAQREKEDQELAHKIAIEEQLPNAHHGIICDVCQCAPIVGTRFKCFQCPDFDLCANCEPNHHREHLMIRIPEPKNLYSLMNGQYAELKLDVPVRQPIGQALDCIIPAWITEATPIQANKFPECDFNARQSCRDHWAKKQENEKKANVTEIEPETMIYEEKLQESTQNTILPVEEEEESIFKIVENETKKSEEEIKVAEEEIKTAEEPKVSIIKSFLENAEKLAENKDKEGMDGLFKKTFENNSNIFRALGEFFANPNILGYVMRTFSSVDKKMKGENVEQQESKEEEKSPLISEEEPEVKEGVMTDHQNHLIEQLSQIFEGQPRTMITDIVMDNSNLSLEELVDLMCVQTTH